MTRASYQYKWKGDDLIIRFKKRGRTIKAQLGNAVFTISRRTPPKKYVKAVTGRATARKGIIPNSLIKLNGRWGFYATTFTIEMKSFTDDFETVHKLAIPKLNGSGSFHHSGENINFDGGTVVSELIAKKIFD
jgi:hypothetical protein